jgi:type IV pilus assembly protein PilE
MVGFSEKFNGQYKYHLYFKKGGGNFSMLKKRFGGFSLMELMVAVAIVAIIGAIAFPSYLGYMNQTRRSDGQTALLDLSNRMERYFTNNNTYVGATLATLGANATSPEGFYTVSISNAGATTYTLQAVPQGAQTGDTTCGTLSIDQVGQKGETGTGTVQDCW